MGEAALPLIGLAVGVGTSIYQGREAREQAQDARREARAYEARQTARQDEMRRISEDDEERTQAARAARERQRMLAASASGRRSTILTPSIGELGEAPTVQRQLIGG